MKAHNFNAVNGIFTLVELKPSFIQFAKSDISDLKRMTEERDVIWANTRIKAIGCIVVGAANKSKSNFPKSFMRNLFNTRKTNFFLKT